MICYFVEQLKIRPEHTITLLVYYGIFIKGNNIENFFKKHDSHSLSIYSSFVLKETKDLPHLMLNTNILRVYKCRPWCSVNTRNQILFSTYSPYVFF